MRQFLEAMNVQVLIGKYSNHLPLYRQPQIFAHQDIELDCSTLCNWLRASAEGRRNVSADADWTDSEAYLSSQHGTPHCTDTTDCRKGLRTVEDPRQRCILIRPWCTSIILTLQYQVSHTQSVIQILRFLRSLRCVGRKFAQLHDGRINNKC